jgi:hypothetical protein
LDFFALGASGLATASTAGAPAVSNAGAASSAKDWPENAKMAPSTMNLENFPICISKILKNGRGAAGQSGKSISLTRV